MTEDQLLEYLRAYKTHTVSGEEISRKFKISRTAVWKHVQNLRKLGYEIEAETHSGYKLLAAPDKLYADEIQHGLKTQFIGKKIYSYESLDSTNDACFKLGESHAAEGTCVVAEYQKKGKGRLGRSWESPKGKNLLLSILFRPSIAPSEASKMTLLTAVSICRTLKELYGFQPGIKWPNDILYKDKKLCGILTELSAESDRVHFVVVGMGINVNAAAGELLTTAASLKTITGKSIDRLELARAILRQIEKDYQLLKKNKFSQIAEEWEKFSETSGKRVEVEVMGRKVQGQAMGIDEDGALWLRRDNGLQQKVSAGDVYHLR